MLQRIQRKDMKVDCHYDGGIYRAQIPNPPLSTVSFKCPTCGTGINHFCYPERDEDVNCPARVEMYIRVFNGWVERIQKNLIPCFISEKERKEQIQEIIQEVAAKMKEEQKHMLEEGFKVVAEHVQDIVDNHNVIPAEISIPYEENGRWIRLTLSISPVRDQDPEAGIWKRELPDENTVGYYVKKQIPIKAEQQAKSFTVCTKEGLMNGKVGDYLVTGARGERYPVDKDIFEETYYEVSKNVYDEYWEKHNADA